MEENKRCIKIIYLLLVFFLFINSVTFSDAYNAIDGQSMGEYPLSCVENGLLLSSELEQTVYQGDGRLCGYLNKYSYTQYLRSPVCPI